MSRVTGNEIERRLAALDAAVHGEDSEQAILAALEDDLQRVREHAVTLAVRHLEPETLGTLVADDGNATLRNAALEALERQGPYALEHLETMVRGDNPEVTMFAIHALARVRAAESVPLLVASLDHEDENVALAAIEALGDLGAREAVPRLSDEIQGSFWRRFAVVRTLGRIGDSRVVPVIEEVLNDPMLVEPAVEALGEIGTLECLEPLQQTLETGEPTALRYKALLGLARIVERHPLGAVRNRLGGSNGELDFFLRGLLISEDATLARAASTLVVTLERTPLYRSVLLRVLDEEERRWAQPLLRRYAETFERQLPRLLEDREPDVRRIVLELGHFGAASLDPIRELLDDADPSVQVAAVRAIGNARLEAAAPELLQRLSVADDRLRGALVDALSRMPAAALDDLEQELDPGLDAVRLVAALQIAGAAGCRQLGETLTALLADVRPEVRKAAIRASTGVVRDKAALVAMLDDPDDEVAIAAVEACAEHERTDAVPMLCDLLRRNGFVRYHVIRALGRLKACSAASALRDLFHYAEPFERIEVLSALICIRPSWIVPFLKDQFWSGDADLRRTAAEGLIGIPDALRLEELLVMAVDEDWSIRSYVAWALGRRSTETARETLLNLARDVEPLVAATARNALEGFHVR